MNIRRASSALALLLTLGAGTAQAELARVGPINSANGYPQWYQDKTGLAMDFCQNQTQAELSGGWCLLLPPDVPSGTAPETFPTNFSEEHFFWAANAGVRNAPIPGSAETAVALLVLGVEGAFLNGPVNPGDQVVFARLRFKLNPVPFDGTYTFYTPFGKYVLPDQVAGQARGIFFTEDIGLAAGEFQDALKGRIGPFLLPSPTPGGTEVPPIPDLQAGQDPFYDILVNTGAASAYPGNGKKYIADPARLGPITGSPLPDYVVGDGTTRNANIFRIEGPNGFVYETTDFTLMGRVFDGPIAGSLSVDRASYARDATSSLVSVYATAFPAVQGRIPGAAATPTVTTQLSFYNAPCASALDAAGNPVPPYGAPAGVTPVQMFDTGKNRYGQQANVASIPTEVCVQQNSIDATGQTVSTFVPAGLGDQVFITEALFDAAQQSLSIKATSSDGIVPQTLTVEGLGTIDPATGQLLVSPLLAPPATVAVLSSGRGLNEMQVSPGVVAGPPPALPVAVNDSAALFEDCSATMSSTACTTPLVIDVLVNDANAAGGTVSLVTPAGLGTATVNADGTISYTPRLNVNGTDSFSYRVTVGAQVSNEAIVSVAIAPVNDAPVAINDTAGAMRGISNSVNVRANDTDPDGAADLAGVVIATGNANLGVTAGTTFADGIVSFIPPSTTPAGPYTFTYNVLDQAGVPSASPATVTVNLSTAEAIVPGKSLYTAKSGRWVVDGTISPAAGQTMRIIYVDGTYKVNGACTGSAAGTQIGTAAVDGVGNWAYDQILTSTAGVLNPTNTLGNSSGFWCSPPKTLRITSSLTGGSATSAIGVK